MGLKSIVRIVEKVHQCLDGVMSQDGTLNNEIGFGIGRSDMTVQSVSAWPSRTALCRAH